MKKRRGIVLAEIILVSALMGIWVAALAAGAFRALESSSASDNRNKALSLATEGIEAARSIRNRQFSNLNNGSFILDLNNDQWNFTTGTEQIDNFLRSVEIVELHPDVKQVNVTVNWQESNTFNKSITLSSVLTNWQKTVSGQGNWTEPYQGTSVDQSSASGAHRLYIQGQTFYATVQQGTVEFMTYDISDPDDPAILDTFSAIPGTPWDVVVVGDYAYITGNDNGSEITILDVSDPSNITFEASIDLPGKGDSYDLVVDGNYLYVTRNGDGDITVLDITNPTAPTITDSLNVNGYPETLSKYGNYVYLGSTSNSQEIQVIDVTDPNNIFFVVSIGIGGNSNVTAILAQDNRLYVGQDDGSFYIYSIDVPILPVNIGYIDLSQNIHGIEKNGNLVFVGTEDNTQEFIVLDTTNEASPSIFGALDLDFDVGDIVYYEAADLVYCGFRNGTFEMVIVLPS